MPNGASMSRSSTNVLASVCSAVVALFSAGVAELARGSDEVRVEVDLFVPPLQRLEIVSPILVMPELTSTDLAPTYVELPRPITLRVSSNTAWELSVRAADGGIASGRDELGADLYCAIPRASFQPLSDDWLRIADGPAGEEIEIELFLRAPLTPGLLIPGHHEVRLDYRLSADGN